MVASPTAPKVRRNPRNSARTAERLQDAADFYQEFHWGDAPDKTVRRKASKRPKVGVKLGTLHSVAYETHKDGEEAIWEHEFGEEGGDKPDLVMDVDNKKLHIVGGSYDVEDRGIVD